MKLWPGCELPRASDLVEVDEEALKAMGIQELSHLAEQLGIIPIGYPRDSADQLRSLFAKHAIDLR